MLVSCVEASPGQHARVPEQDMRQISTYLRLRFMQRPIVCRAHVVY